MRKLSEVDIDRDIIEPIVYGLLHSNCGHLIIARNAAEGRRLGRAIMERVEQNPAYSIMYASNIISSSGDCRIMFKNGSYIKILPSSHPDKLRGRRAYETFVDDYIDDRSTRVKIDPSVKECNVDDLQIKFDQLVDWS